MVALDSGSMTQDNRLSGTVKGVGMTCLTPSPKPTHSNFAEAQTTIISAPAQTLYLPLPMDLTRRTLTA